MVGFGAVKTNINTERMIEYQAKLDTLSLQELVKEFISYLDYTEESDSGTVFHPITIGSCRILMQEPLHKVLTLLRSKVNEN